MLAVAVSVLVQLPTLWYYYYQDDYVYFGEIVHNGNREYIWRLITGTDLTPNWRPLPGLLYLASYDLSGMNPMLVHAAMLAFHAGTVLLLYYATWRVTGRAWAACAGALAFGIHPAYAGALGQVAAAHVMAGFTLLATLVAAIECALARSRRGVLTWLAVAVASFGLTIGSHEAMAVMFPAFGLTMLTFDPRSEGRLVRAALRTAPLAIVSLAAVGAGAACRCNERGGIGTDYAWSQMQIYAGRFIYPVGLEPPWHVSTVHAVAAAALAVAVAVTCAFGPKIARIGALWMVLALVPHVVIQFFTAGRYMYVTAPGFALVFASAAIMIADVVPRPYARTLALAAIPLFAVLLTWYARETLRQNDEFGQQGEVWRGFHRDVTSVYPTVPRGAQVKIIGGPFTDYLYQLNVLPAFAQTTWGPGVALYDLVPGDEPAKIWAYARGPYVAEYRDGHLVPLEPPPPNQ